MVRSGSCGDRTSRGGKRPRRAGGVRGSRIFAFELAPSAQVTSSVARRHPGGNAGHDVLHTVAARILWNREVNKQLGVEGDDTTLPRWESGVQQRRLREEEARWPGPRGS